MADLGDLSSEKREELWKSFQLGDRLREMMASSPLRDLQASIAADMKAQRELLSGLTMSTFKFTMPKFDALEAFSRMPPVLDGLKNFAMEMATVSSRIDQMHASVVARFNDDLFRQTSSSFEKMRAEVAQIAALQHPKISLPVLMPMPPLPAIAQSFANLADIEWRDDKGALRKKVADLEEQVRELQAQVNPPQPPEQPQPPDDPTLHTGQYL